MRNRRPSTVLRSLMEFHGITQEQLAAVLGSTRYSVNQLVNDRRGVTPEMALRLGRAFNTSPEFWLDLQRRVDLDEARSRLEIELKAIRVLR